MAFKTVTKQSYKRILALLLGAADTGKSTLLGQLPGPVAAIDSDIRIDEVIETATAEIYSQVDDLAANTDIQKSLHWLEQNMPGSNVKAIVWDSITPILEPIISEAMRLAEMTPDQREAVGAPRNKATLWEPKARAMREILSIAGYGTHCVWTAHYEPGRDNKGQKHERKTIPETEFDRMTKALNMKLRTVKVNKGGQVHYGVQIEWLRSRPGFQTTLWDPPGNMFKGMWERILEALNGEPQKDEPVQWEDFGEHNPFPSPDTAIQLAVEHFVEYDGQQIYAFGDPLAEAIRKNGQPGTNGATAHARNAYEKVKKEVMTIVGKAEWKKKHAGDPAAAAKEMAKHWQANVERRIQEKIEALKQPVDDTPPPPPAEEELTEQAEMTF